MMPSKLFFNSARLRLAIIVSACLILSCNPVVASPAAARAGGSSSPTEGGEVSVDSGDGQGAVARQKPVLRVGNCIGHSCAIASLAIGEGESLLLPNPRNTVAVGRSNRSKRQRRSFRQKRSGVEGRRKGSHLSSLLSMRGRSGLRGALRKMLRKRRNFPGFERGSVGEMMELLPPQPEVEEEGQSVLPPPPPSPPHQESANFNREGSAVQTSSFPSHLNPIFSGYKFLERGECRPAPDGRRMFFCPSPAADGSHHCVRTDQYCDGVPDCPNGEDEDQERCFFYRPLVSQLEDLAQTLNRVFRPLFSSAPPLPPPPSSSSPSSGSPQPSWPPEEFDPTSASASRVRIEPVPSSSATHSLGYLPPAPPPPETHLPGGGGGGGVESLGDIDFDLIRRIQAEEDTRQLEMISRERERLATQSLSDLEELLLEGEEDRERQRQRQFLQQHQQQEQQQQQQQRQQQQQSEPSRGTVSDFEGFRKLRS